MKKFKIVLQKEEEGGYSVSVIGLPGCFTQGDNVRDALSNAREAIECYIEGLAKDGLRVEDLPKAEVRTLAVGG